MQTPKISIVTALYQSAPYIKEFHARHVRCLKEMGVDFEFIFVDDGSPDDSDAVVRELMRSQPQITLVSLSRNCGQHAAMQAGLAHATGDYVCALDVDLEEEPENIVGMFEWFRKAPEIDVVYGVVERRSAGFLRDRLSRAVLFRTELDVAPESCRRPGLAARDDSAVRASIVAIPGINVAVCRLDAACRI